MYYTRYKHLSSGASIELKAYELFGSPVSLETLDELFESTNPVAYQERLREGRTSSLGSISMGKPNTYHARYVKDGVVVHAAREFDSWDSADFWLLIQWHVIRRAAELKLDEHIQKAIDAAPPLTTTQRVDLGILLSGGHVAPKPRETIRAKLKPSRVRRVWTTEDDAVVLDETLAGPEAANKIGRTLSQVHCRRSVLRKERKLIDQTIQATLKEVTNHAS